jgi:hypothetical protein
VTGRWGAKTQVASIGVGLDTRAPVLRDVTADPRIYYPEPDSFCAEGYGRASGGVACSGFRDSVRLSGSSTSDVFAFAEAEWRGGRLGSSSRTSTPSKEPAIAMAGRDPRTGELAFGTIRLRMVVEDIAGNRTRSPWIDVVARPGTFSKPPLL